MDISSGLPSMIHKSSNILYQYSVKYFKIALILHLRQAVVCIKFLQIFSSCRESLQTISFKILIYIKRCFITAYYLMLNIDGMELRKWRQKDVILYEIRRIDFLNIAEKSIDKPQRTCVNQIRIFCSLLQLKSCYWFVFVLDISTISIYLNH